MARSMERADNVEESHFMERTWAALLSRSRPLASSEPKTHVFLAGAWVDLLSQPHAAPTHAVCRVTLADHVRLLLLFWQSSIHCSTRTFKQAVDKLSGRVYYWDV